MGFIPISRRVLSHHKSHIHFVVPSSIVLQSHMRFLNYNEICRNMHLTRANLYLSLNMDVHTLLGPLTIVTRVPLVSVPNPHLCASSLEVQLCF